MKHALFYNPFSPKKNYNFIYLISGDHGRECPLHIVFNGNNAVCRDCIHVLNYNFTLFVLIQKKKSFHIMTLNPPQPTRESRASGI